MQDQLSTFTSATACEPSNCGVFLPGWGFDGRITELAEHFPPWLTPAAPLDPDETVEALNVFLNRQKITSIVLAGWSLGAYQAIDFALLYPEKIKALYLLGLRQSWPPVEIKQLRSELLADPAKFMQTFYRKCFLGHKSDYQKFTASLEESYLARLDHQQLTAGLSYLQNFPLAARTSKLAELDLPVFLLHGARDLIAPVAEMATIPGAASQIIKSAGHPVFLDPACPLDWHRKKETIRLKFSRSAATYDQHAALQHEVAARLAELLPAAAPATVLETGCGTGTYTALLKNKYPGARITALDFADTMLDQARQKLGNPPEVTFHCADAELYLKELQDPVELITSNATMHWFDNLPRTSGLIAERLSAGGSLVCSIFGPATMTELQAGLSAIHGHQVTMPSALFPDLAELRAILTPLFTEVAIDEWQLVRHYPDLFNLLRNISKTGTAGWHPGHHLLSRGHLKELARWFIKTYGDCQISYQVFMVKCQK